MKRKDVPKKVKAMPTAPLVLICEMIRVVTVACSTSTKREINTLSLIRLVKRNTVCPAHHYFMWCDKAKKVTHRNRTRWGLGVWRHWDRALHVQLRTASRNMDPEFPADGSPTPSCKYMKCWVKGLSLKPTETTNFLPIRASFLNPNDIEVLCKICVCWEQQVIEVVWKPLYATLSIKIKPLMHINNTSICVTALKLRFTFSPCIFQVAM